MVSVLIACYVKMVIQYVPMAPVSVTMDTEILIVNVKKVIYFK